MKELAHLKNIVDVKTKYGILDLNCMDINCPILQVRRQWVILKSEPLQFILFYTANWLAKNKYCLFRAEKQHLKSILSARQDNLTNHIP